jgi:hypothetical protein
VPAIATRTLAVSIKSRAIRLRDDPRDRSICPKFILLSSQFAAAFSPPASFVSPRRPSAFALGVYPEY